MDLIDCVIEYSESCHPSTTFKGKRASIPAIQYIRIKGNNQIDAIPRQELPETSPIAGQCPQSQSNGDAGRKVIQRNWRSRTHAKRVPGAFSRRENGEGDKRRRGAVVYSTPWPSELLPSPVKEPRLSPPSIATISARTSSTSLGTVLSYIEIRSLGCG